MDLERNNLNAQISIMKDIISDYGSINYDIKQRGDELVNITAKAKRSDDMKTVSFSKEDFERICAISRMLQSENDFERLGNQAKTAVPNIRAKKEILNILQKQ